MAISEVTLEERVSRRFGPSQWVYLFARPLPRRPIPGAHPPRSTTCGSDSSRVADRGKIHPGRGGTWAVELFAERQLFGGWMPWQSHSLGYTKLGSSSCGGSQVPAGVQPSHCRG